MEHLLEGVGVDGGVKELEHDPPAHPSCRPSHREGDLPGPRRCFHSRPWLPGWLWDGRRADEGSACSVDSDPLLPLPSIPEIPNGARRRQGAAEMQPSSLPISPRSPGAGYSSLGSPCT